MEPMGDRGSGSRPPGISSRFGVATRGAVHVITFTRGDLLDAHDIAQLGEDLVAYARLQGEPRLVVDMENVNQLSSAALSMIVTLKSNVEGLGGRLRLAAVGPEPRRVLRLSTLDEVIEVHTTVDDAVASLS